MIRVNALIWLMQPDNADVVPRFANGPLVLDNSKTNSVASVRSPE